MVKRIPSARAAAGASEEQGTQAVQRALRLLRCFRPDKPSVSLTEFAEDSGLTTPTTHRLVKALQARGYLLQDPDSRSYSLGPTIMRLAQVMMQRDTQHQLIRLAMPVLERLRDATGETASLVCPLDLQCMCVAEVPSRHVLRVTSGLGAFTPLGIGAAGMVLLAWSNPVVVERAAEKLRSTAGDDPVSTKLLRELPWTRKKGYAMTLGESSAIAVPVFSGSGVIGGAIAVSGPVERWTRDRMLDEAPMIMAEGGTISSSLGYAGGLETTAL